MITSDYNKHYDSSLEYVSTIYDNLPYQKDVGLCGEDKIAMFSGNVIKYYCCTDAGPRVIPTQDDKTDAYLSQKKQEILQKIKAEHDDYIKEAIEEGLEELTHNSSTAEDIEENIEQDTENSIENSESQE